MRIDKNLASSTLFGVAAIQAVVCILGWLMYSPEFTTLDWIITFSFSFFLILGIIARFSKKPAVIIAVVLYGSFLILQAFISVQLLMTGLIFKIPILLFLLLAVYDAFKSRRGTQKVVQQQ